MFLANGSSRLYQLLPDDQHRGPGEQDHLRLHRTGRKRERPFVVTNRYGFLQLCVDQLGGVKAKKCVKYQLKTFIF
jgi:hypothetical protein